MPAGSLAMAGEESQSLAKKSFKEIIENYSFIADFSAKESTRELPTAEVFWRYPFVIEHKKFPIEFKTSRDEMPVTEGDGRAYQHMNSGRAAFLAGDYEKAKKVWLTQRALYGSTYEHHRRLDYFLGVDFLNLVYNNPTEAYRPKQQQLLTDDNAATFLSHAFQMKKDVYDPFLDSVAGKSFYNLAALYYNHERFAGAYAAAGEGLDFLRKKGLLGNRVELHQVLAETYIQNRSYLNAAQELDTALRLNVKPQKASEIFARVGDMYFDLNNFELAEESYALAAAINNEFDQINPDFFILRGESLFWLGKFSEAQKMFHYALNYVGRNENDLPLSRTYASIASLRMADSWLARGDYVKLQAARTKFLAAEKAKDKTRAGQKELQRLRQEYDKVREPFDKAKIAYDKHIHDFMEFKGNQTVNYARIRLACLELPEYGGYNIDHARTTLNDIRTFKHEVRPEAPADDETDDQERQRKLQDPGPLDPEALHMAWACEVASYTERERTEQMVDRVRDFAKSYPQSRFLQEMAEPVKSVQAMELGKYIKDKKFFEAADFFEKNRSLLFKEVSDDLKCDLFEIYTDLYAPEKAAEFFEAYEKRNHDDIGFLRLAVVAAEMADNKKDDKWTAINRSVAARMADHEWSAVKDNALRLYLERIINSKSRHQHIVWILKIGKMWAEKETKESTAVCEILYPALSQAWDNQDQLPISAETIQKEAIGMIDHYLEEVMQFETFCGYSLLQLEYRLLKDNPTLLASRMLAREYIPINVTTAGLLWALAEDLNGAGEKAGAQRIWEFLVAKGSDDIIEVRYAKSRLDKTRTEVEDLWKK